MSLWVHYILKLTLCIWLLNLNQFHNLTYTVRRTVTVNYTQTSALAEHFWSTLSDCMDLWHRDMLWITVLPTSLISRMRCILINSVRISYKSSLIKRKIHFDDIYFSLRTRKKILMQYLVTGTNNYSWTQCSDLAFLATLGLHIHITSLLHQLILHKQISQHVKEEQLGHSLQKCREDLT